MAQISRHPQKFQPFPADCGSTTRGNRCRFERRKGNALEHQSMLQSVAAGWRVIRGVVTTR
jgi:hypothetical protein